jgi:hypothetical protein
MHQTPLRKMKELSPYMPQGFSRIYSRQQIGDKKKLTSCCGRKFTGDRAGIDCAMQRLRAWTISDHSALRKKFSS